MILFWSAPAIDDLKALRNFIAHGSEYYAAEFVHRILNAIEKLERFPQLGRPVPELRDAAAREIIFQNYRILYRLRPGRIDIAAIIHGRRDLKRKMARRWEIL